MTKTDEEKDSEILDEVIRILENSPECSLLSEKLRPLVATASKVRNEKVDEDLHELITRFEKSGKRMSLLKKDSKAGYDDQLSTIRKAFLFLALFETSVTNLLDCIVFLLVLNGHDFFVQYARKYAKSLDDLDDSSLAEKLDFLNLHGYLFITEYINRSLRNKIAHMDFDIEERGMIVVKNQKYNLETELTKLGAIVLLVGKALSNAGFGTLLVKGQ